MNEQDIILLLQQKNEDGLTALTLHYGPLMRYIIAPILPNPQDQEDCLAEVTLRVGTRSASLIQNAAAGKPGSQPSPETPRSIMCAH